MDFTKKLEQFADKVKRFVGEDAGLIDIVYVAVYLGIAVVAGAIILYITQQVVTITGTPSNSHLSNASSNLLNTADIGYSFLPIVAVAAIGSIAIGYVFGLIPGMSKGGGGGAI